MNTSQDWQNFATHNEHLRNTDTSEADRRYHEQERQRAEDRARAERDYERRREEERNKRR